MVTLHKHNSDTYQKIVSLFSESDRVCAVQPTGTGKSFLILKLIEDNPDKQFVISAPNNYVFGQIKNHAADNKVSLDNCRFMTYTSIYELQEPVNISCDYLITDEFHRLGASTWNSGIMRFLNSHSCKVLGTSATPIRYLDSMRNMAEELFNSNYAVNMTLAEAIQMKILPLPIYVTTLYSFHGEIAQLEQRVEKTDDPRLKLFLVGKLQQAKSMISALDCGLETVFERHIKNKSGKYIVFCPDTDKLANIYEECDSWFIDINRKLHKYSVYSSNYNSKIEYEGFCNDNDESALKLLFCIDMLNEGIHIDKIDGVIMLRPTQSANIFYQQLGRALSCSLQNPVIFDIVNNYETGDTANQYAQIMLASRQNGTSTEINIDFEIFDYVRDIRDILNELHDTFESPWEFTFETLKQYVEETGYFPTIGVIYQGLRIGSWSATQRTKERSGSLLPERKMKLDEINFPWNPQEEKWYRNYYRMKQYVEKYGSVPTDKMSKIDKEAHDLYVWKLTQKGSFKTGNLTERQIQLLAELGITFSLDSIDDKWNRKYEMLKKYIDENGRFPGKADGVQSKEIKSLASWLHLQRYKYKQGKLSSEQITLLEELDFVWDTEDESWNCNFELFHRFYMKNERLPKNKERMEGSDMDIGQWYNKQVRLYQNGELSEERINKFRSIGITFITYKQEAYDRYWMSCFELFKKYLSEFNTVPVARDEYEGCKIGNWYSRVLKDYHAENLSEEKTEMIRSLGINFETRTELNEIRKSQNKRLTRDEIWNMHYETLCSFIRENGRLPKRSEIYRDFGISTWLYLQRRQYRNGELSEVRLERLKALNVNGLTLHEYFGFMEKSA